jgi:hypothetical protein
MLGFGENGNETSGSIKDGEFFDQLNVLTDSSEGLYKVG